MLQATLREILRHDEALVATSISTALLANAGSRDGCGTVPADSETLRVTTIAAQNRWIGRRTGTGGKVDRLMHRINRPIGRVLCQRLRVDRAANEVGSL